MKRFVFDDKDGDRIEFSVLVNPDPERFVSVFSRDHSDGEAAAVHLNRKAVKRLRKWLKRALNESKENQ